MRRLCSLRASIGNAVHRRRGYATVTANTVSDHDIARLASKPLHPLTLRDLIRHGRPPLSSASLYDTANFALSILPTRLAHRIQALRNLPFIVVTNPNVSSIHDNYMHSLAAVLPFAERKITSLKDEAEFVNVMEGLVQTHGSTIPVLARGFLETRKYIAPSAVTSFLDQHLRARIGTRMIAEQNIALHNSSQLVADPIDHEEAANSPSSGYIGIIDTALQPARVVRSCEAFVSDLCEFKYGVRPSVVINGEPETTIAHVPMHLVYILTELLKNAFRATIERGNERNPVEITIAPAPEDSPPATEVADTQEQGVQPPSDPNILPLEHATPGVTIRIRDQGGGISAEDLKNVWAYSFTTYDESEATSGGLDMLSTVGSGGSTIAGLGYGLPLSRAYAEYFGGGISLHSLEGWGTDVFVSLRGVGRVD